MKIFAKIPIALIILTSIFSPIEAQAYDINSLVNQLFKTDTSTLQGLMPGSISTTFGINGGGFNLNNLLSPSNLTALTPTSDYAKLLQAVVAKNPSTTASTVDGEIKNTITKSVIASQGTDSLQKAQTITSNAAASSSLFASNSSTTYESNLDAMQALHSTMSEIGGGINTVQAQNIDLGKGIQVANEMQAQQVTYQLSKDRVQDDTNSRAISIKYANSRINDPAANKNITTNSF
jgi:hypothetical protein